VVIEVKLTTLAVVWYDVISHQFSVTVSWTTKQQTGFVVEGVAVAVDEELVYGRVTI